MAKYSRSYSNYIIPQKQQNTTEGSIYWRDWNTIGERHRLEEGKRPYFGSANFMFTENSILGFPKKITYGKWLGHYTYEDVKNAHGLISSRNKVPCSNDLRDYAYYGSCYDLVRTSIEYIVSTFPGRLTVGDETFVIRYDDTDVETPYFVVSNPFGINLHFRDANPSLYENYLRYMSYAFGYYDVIQFDADGEEINHGVVDDYVITDLTNVIPDAEIYHNMGYDFVEYNGRLFQWDCNKCDYRVADVDNVDYFVPGSKIMRYGGKYYMWVGETLTPINVYTLCIKDYALICSVEFTIHKGTLKEHRYTLYGYKVSGNMVWASETKNIAIQPQQRYIDAYFEELEGFEKVLLNTTTNPLYMANLIMPVRNSGNGYDYIGGTTTTVSGAGGGRNRSLTWPSDGYCIIVDTTNTNYVSYIATLTEIALAYDEMHSDVIWRCMTHEAIKNFDWSYRRDYDEELTREHVEGGDRMMKILRICGRVFDSLKMYVDGIRNSSRVTYDGYNNATNIDIGTRNFLSGWDNFDTLLKVTRYTEIVDRETCEENYFIECTEYLHWTLPESHNYSKWVCDNTPQDEGAEGECPIKKDLVVPEFLKNQFHSGREYTEYVCARLSEAETVLMESMPCNINDDSPEFISVGCNCDKEENSIYRKEMALADSVSLSTSYLYGCYNDETGSDSECIPYVTKEIPWVTRGLAYMRIATKPEYEYQRCCDGPNIPIPLSDNYFDDKTVTVIPSNIDENFPTYIRRTMPNGTYAYYQLTSFFDPNRYIHEKWYPNVNLASVTAVSNDLDLHRRMALSTDRIFASKGTQESIDMVMALFGLGREDNGNGDYSLTEFYRTTTPKSYDEGYYYYTPINIPTTVLPVEMDSVPCDPGANSPEEIKVGSQYYKLDGGEKLSDIIYQIYSSKMSAPDYESVFSGSPLNNVNINNKTLVVPYYENGRRYEGGLYFQQQGGWGQHANGTQWMETISYLHIVPFFSDLLQTVPMQLRERDIYYVANISDYDVTLPSDISHFFVVTDRYNSFRRSSWAYIPMSGAITLYPGYTTPQGATHEDYMRAAYLDSIISTNVGNNPHCGFGRYDAGEEYFDYMTLPYKESIETNNFDDTDVLEKAKNIKFCIDKHPVTDANISVLSNGKVFDKRLDDGKSYILNDKVLIFRNLRNNDRFKRYLKDSILPYVMQVIPSTTILILENIDTNCMDDISLYPITVESNNDDYGVAVGSGLFSGHTTTTITAIPREGYHFVGWKVRDCMTSTDSSTDHSSSDSSDEFISTDPYFTINVCQCQIYTAYFEEDCNVNFGCGVPCVQFETEEAENCSVMFISEVDTSGDIRYYSLNVVVQPSPDAGTITFSQNGPYLAGSEVIINATANSGYTWVGWADDASIPEGNRTITVTQNTTLYVNFNQEETGS